MRGNMMIKCTRCKVGRAKIEFSNTFDVCKRCLVSSKICKRCIVSLQRIQLNMKKKRPLLTYTQYRKIARINSMIPAGEYIINYENDKFITFVNDSLTFKFAVARKMTNPTSVDHFTYKHGDGKTYDFKRRTKYIWKVKLCSTFTNND